MSASSTRCCRAREFDPKGRYVRRFVPELARLPDKWLHRPWEAPAEVLRGAGLVLGRDYPQPVIDHAAGRTRALAAFATLGAAGGAPGDGMEPAA
ncbi:FAD-binding domain-containing protein [Dankookia sp. P2]|uniref:FAD-binding domain-containing protein n=1 Tax=Dankookia sp. P2 TaxID=3423955 RepID=UPI003D6644DD